MKRICLISIVGIIVFISCKPYQILYSVEYIQPSMIEDSVYIKMIDTTALFANGRCIIGLALEITNKKRNNIIVGNNNIDLLLKNDSMTWYLKKESNLHALKSDSISYIKNNETKSLKICCYNVRDSLSASVLINYRLTKKENHRLILYLDIKDEDQNKIEKQVILKPVKAKIN